MPGKLPPTQQALFALVTKRAREVIDAESLKRKLASGRHLRVKLGVDPTSPYLHIGHLVPFRMLRAFQDAGHVAVVIIGDFTAQVGDPSWRQAARRPLTPTEVKVNERTYLAQIEKAIDVRRAEIHHNSEWYRRMKFSDFLRLLTNFSLRSAWEREDFQKRLRAGREVRLHEAMYLVLQAYDSVAVRSDIELGAVDQKLNNLAGRELQRALGQLPQDVVLFPYLIGLDGKLKMSKSIGNTINLDDSAKDMFGKVMSIPDALIRNYAELAAWMPPERVHELEVRLRRGQNPRDVKLDVAAALVTLYYGIQKARRAGEEFIWVFSQRKLPRAVPRVQLEHRPHKPMELLLALGVSRSKSEARRLLAGRALEVNGRVVDPRSRSIKIEGATTIRVGKRRFFCVV